MLEKSPPSLLLSHLLLSRCRSFLRAATILYLFCRYRQLSAAPRPPSLEQAPAATEQDTVRLPALPLRTSLRPLRASRPPFAATVSTITTLPNVLRALPPDTFRSPGGPPAPPVRLQRRHWVTTLSSSRNVLAPPQRLHIPRTSPSPRHVLA